MDSNPDNFEHNDSQPPSTPDEANKPKVKKAWHLNSPVSIKLDRLLIFALVFVAIGGYALYKTFAIEVEPTVDSNTVALLAPANSTASLLNLINEKTKAPMQKKADVDTKIRAFVQARKDTMLKAINNDPQAAVEAALPSSDTAQLPTDTQSSVEQLKQVTGKFEYLHFDNLEDHQAQDNLYVTDQSSGKKYQVHLPNKQKENLKAKTGDTVSVSGVQLDDHVATTDVKVLNSVHAATTTTNSKKVAVFMFNFQNDKSTVSQSTIQGLYFTNSNSANAYYKDSSYGKLQLAGKNNSSGDLYGWYTVPYDSTGCDVSSWSNSVDAQAQTASIDLSGYDIISYITSSRTGCGFAGVSNIGGSPSRSWILSTAPRTISHELGHNLGAYHASGLKCNGNGTTVAISQNCDRIEYGDPFSVMGSEDTTNCTYTYTSGGTVATCPYYSMNNFHRGATNDSLNWLAASNTLTINKATAPDGTYTIVPVETSTSSVNTIRIPRTIAPDGSVSDYYYLEYRQPNSSFDKFPTSSPEATGISIRLAPDYSVEDYSKLIDTTPASGGGFNDAPLKAGQSFSDSDKGITITPVSTSSSSATVKVSFTGSGGIATSVCTHSNPTLTINPVSSSIYPGQATTFSYNLKNNDSPACSESNFTVGQSSSLNSSLSSSPSQNSFILAPGESTSGTVIISTASTISPSTYTFNLQANNSTVVGYSASSSFSVIIQQPAPTSNTGPKVSIVEPKVGQKLPGGDFNIKATASDVSGIRQIVISFDGRVVNTCYSVSSCTAKVKGNTVAKGGHTITASATNNGTPLSSTSTATISAIK